MTITLSVSIGDTIQIHTGNTGKALRGVVVWAGTAEDIGEMAQGMVPALLVATTKGEVAVTLWTRHPSHPPLWTVVRPVREWETADGDLVGDVDPAMGARIDAGLRMAIGLAAYIK